MIEPEIPISIYLFVLCEFLVGAVVGTSVSKDPTSSLYGMAISLFLAIGVIIFWVTIGSMMIVPPGKLLAAIITTLLFLFFLWFICLLAAAAGYWSAFIVSSRFGIGQNRVTLASIFAFITVLAAVAAVARTG